MSGCELPQVDFDDCPIPETPTRSALAALVPQAILSAVRDIVTDNDTAVFHQDEHGEWLGPGVVFGLPEVGSCCGAIVVGDRYPVTVEEPADCYTARLPVEFLVVVSWSGCDGPKPKIVDRETIGRKLVAVLCCKLDQHLTDGCDMTKIWLAGIDDTRIDGACDQVMFTIRAAI